MGQHSLLSPSSAHRWLECTPSAVAESKVPDTPSGYAIEGSLAHAMCAMKLNDELGRETAAIEMEEEVRDLYVKNNGLESEMALMREYVDAYVMAVMDIYEQEKFEEEKHGGTAEIHIETRLDLGDWAPDTFGTADAIVVGPHRLTVIDFKYGRGVEVRAKGNPQMRMYALGALDEFGVERDIEEVRMMIWQPRLRNFSTDQMTRRELLDWGTYHLSPLANVAALGLGARHAGKWCKFCRAADTCTALDDMARIAGTTEITRADARSLGTNCLPMIAPLEIWIDTARKQALKLMMAGEEVPGYKVVNKRTLRRISDPRRMADLLRDAGFDDSRIFKEPPLRSISELEKLVGKKKLTELAGDLIVKPQGEPTIAEDGDRRAEYDTAGFFRDIAL